MHATSVRRRLLTLAQAYDYAGAWLDFTANQANVNPDGINSVSTAQALDHYFGTGATKDKMVLGIPLYGRGFENTDGLGKSYSGVGAGTTQEGVWSYENLPCMSSPFPLTSFVD